MNEVKKSSLFPGLFLIIIGVLLLVNKFVPDFIGWRHLYPIILIVLGFSLISSACCKHKHDKGAVFPGTILFLIGVFFFLRNFDIVPYYYVRDVWPIFVIIFGLGFLALFIAKPSDWGSLIPAGIFLALGVFYLLREYYIIDWEIGEFIGDYWPVILIIVGGSIIAGALKKTHEIDDQAEV